MKTTTLNKTICRSTFLLIFALFLNISTITAQVSDWGNLYVSDNGQMHVVTGAYTFQSPLVGTQTSTTRTASTYGRISFADAIVNTAISPAIATDRYVDGYVRKYGILPFECRIGQGSTYAPAKLTSDSALVGDAIDAAFYSGATSTVGTTLDANSVSAVLTNNYWHILRGSGTPNALISLSWRAANNIATLTTGSLNSLKIAGWDGTKWVAIPSALDVTNVFDATASTATAGSITTAANVNLGTYQFFTLAAEVACQPTNYVATASSTWNGSAWSNGTPSFTTPAILAGNYFGNLTCFSLVVNTGVTMTLSNGQLLEVVNGITTTGTGVIKMSSEASLVQRADVAGTANIELTKTSRPMKWRDYMYYGSPVAGGGLIPQLYTTNVTSANLTNTTVLNNGVTNNVFDYGHTSTSGGGPWAYTSGTTGGWTPAFGSVTGKGFIVRVGSFAPWTTFAAAGAAGLVNFKMVGVANNGTIDVPLSIATSNRAELISNPYPSAIDAQKFLIENNGTGKANYGSLYFWSSNTPRVAPGTATYTAADYAIWSLAGATNTSPIANKPDGKVASGQGFFIRPTGTTPTGANKFRFTNCMRLTGGNNNFFKQASNVFDRYYLNVQDNNSNGAYSQILVTYLPETTNEFDNMYDADRYSVSPVQLYTILADNTKLGINARAPFVDTDVIALGFSNTTTDQSFTITLQDKEGVFASNTVNVYIHDLLDNTYHDMNTPFTFNTNGATSLNSRFKIVYQGTRLSSTDFLANSVVLNIKNGTLSALAKNIGITNVEIFDITGRKVQSYLGNNKTSMSESFTHAEGVYVAKVKLENGSIATQKLINKK